MKHPKAFPYVFALQAGLLGGYYAIWQVAIIKRGFDLHDLGILLSLQTFITLVADFPTGVLADKLGHGILTICGFLLYILAFLAPCLSTSPWSLGAGVLLIGLGDCCVNGALDGWLTEAAGLEDHQTKDSYIIREYWAGSGRVIGAIALPAIIFYLGEPLRLSWVPFLFGGVLLFAVGALCLSNFPSSTTRKGTGRSPANPGIASSLKACFSEPVLRTLLLSCFLFGVSDGATSLYLRPRLMTLGYSSFLILGFIQASFTLSRLLGIKIYAKTKMSATRNAMGLALFSSGILAVLFTFASSPPIALCLWLFRIALLAIYFPLMKSALTGTRLGKIQNATVLSISSVIAALGSLTMTAFGAMSSTLQNTTLGIQICGAFCIASAFAVYLATRTAKVFAIVG